MVTYNGKNGKNKGLNIVFGDPGRKANGRPGGVLRVHQFITQRPGLRVHQFITQQVGKGGKKTNEFSLITQTQYSTTIFNHEYAQTCSL